MSVITKKYENGVERKLTVLSAQYCNSEHNALIVITEESGAVLISEASSPDLWAQVKASEIAVADYVEPQAPNDPNTL